jgi:hypothetical protein
LPFLCYSGKSMKPPLLGFSHEWTAHSFEAFSRMCVSGLILDPEVPIYAVFASPFADHSIRPVSTAPVVHSAAASTHPPTTLDRKGTLLHRLRSFYGNATRPFALSSPSRYNFPAPLGTASAAASSATLINPAPPVRKRADTTATLLEKTASSSSTAVVPTPYQQPAQEVLVLPFQFSTRLARDITRRNLPYLRHSWTRIDAISVIAFWITFILAQTGLEHGRYHIGIFRALSVLRIARLLAITSGTTVSVTSRDPFGKRMEKLTRVCFVCRPSCVHSRPRGRCSPAWRISCYLLWPCFRMSCAVLVAGI